MCGRPGRLATGVPFAEAKPAPVDVSGGVAHCAAHLGSAFSGCLAGSGAVMCAETARGVSLSLRAVGRGSVASRF